MPVYWGKDSDVASEALLTRDCLLAHVRVLQEFVFNSDVSAEALVEAVPVTQMSLQRRQSTLDGSLQDGSR